MKLPGTKKVKRSKKKEEEKNKWFLVFHGEDKNVEFERLYIKMHLATYCELVFNQSCHV